MPPARRAAAALVVAVTAAALAGCGGADERSRGRDNARSMVEDLVAGTRMHGEEIAQVAARIEEDTRESRIVMIGVEHTEPEGGYGAPIGSVTLGVTLDEWIEDPSWWGNDTRQDPGPHCFEVTFHRRGVLGTERVDCPEGGLVAVPAPPPRLPRIAPNAHEAVWEVLESLDDDLPSELRVVEKVVEHLDPHPDDVTPLARVTAEVRDGAVAVATGDVEDCVLVMRGSNGEVWDVYVPPVYLQPGELGCYADTAFADLRPPH